MAAPLFMCPSNFLVAIVDPPPPASLPHKIIFSAMNLAHAVSAATQVVGKVAANQTEQWSTKIFQCDNIPAEHWVYGIFCTPCAAAHAKSKVDQTNPCFNFLCFTPIGSYSMVRHHYNIMGECGTDMFHGVFCMPCSARHIWTEANLRGVIAGKHGQNSGTWSTELTQCDCSEFWRAAICPCWVSHEVRQLMHLKADNCFDYLCILPTSMYGQVRHTYGIQSEWPHPVCEDLFLGAVCYPCALNRALREAAFQSMAMTSTIAGMANQAQAKVQQAGQQALGKLNALGGKLGGGGGAAMK